MVRFWLLVATMSMFTLTVHLDSSFHGRNGDTITLGSGAVAMTSWYTSVSRVHGH